MNGFITLLIWAWLMASSFIVSGNMEVYASPIATTVFRFVLALFLIFLLLCYQWKKAGLTVWGELKALLISRTQCLHYALISGALVGFFIGLFVALKYTSPLNTSVLYTLVPLIGVFLSRVFLNELLNLLKISGFVLGSVGAMFVLFASLGEASNFSSRAMLGNLLNEMLYFKWNKGDIIFLFSCGLLAIHVVSVQKWGRSLVPLSGAFMIMLFGAIWLIPIALLWGDLETVKWFSPGFWINSLYLTVFATLFTFVLQQRLVASVGASRLLAFSYTIPVWVTCYTAFSQNQLGSLLNMGFILGLLLLGFAYLLIESKLLSYRASSIIKLMFNRP